MIGPTWSEMVGVGRSVTGFLAEYRRNPARLDPFQPGPNDPAIFTPGITRASLL
jgi:hypothetical protein